MFTTIFPLLKLLKTHNYNYNDDYNYTALKVILILWAAMSTPQLEQYREEQYLWNHIQDNFFSADELLNIDS